MIQITLINGSKFNVKSLKFGGVIVDSNGSTVGGDTTIVWTEAELNKLTALAPMQAMYDAAMSQDGGEEESDDGNV